jgi:hypothetical protein
MELPMNPPALAMTPKRAHTFTAPESFGLFMEALRDLQIYADDSEQSAPDAARLEEHLDSALESLTRCHQEFPGDLLPRYYLGITLTMKNQHLYAKSILQQTMRATATPTSPLVNTASQSIVQALLAPRPWPLLDRAINLFQQVIQDGYALLEQAARFNLAHVYAKRDGPGDLQKSLDLLRHLQTSSRPIRSESTGLYRSSFLRKLFQKKDPANERAHQESVALVLQTRTILSTVQARLAIQDNNESQYAASVQAIEAARKDIDETKSLSPEARHDLLADSCTKSGFVFFLHAIRSGSETKELVDAEASLGRALDYKPFWIPAQTYLAMVYIAQARLEDAKKELLSVVGTAPPYSQSPSQTNNVS